MNHESSKRAPEGGFGFGFDWAGRPAENVRTYVHTPRPLCEYACTTWERMQCQQTGTYFAKRGNLEKSRELCEPTADQGGLNGRLHWPQQPRANVSVRVREYIGRLDSSMCAHLPSPPLSPGHARDAGHRYVLTRAGCSMFHGVVREMTRVWMGLVGCLTIKKLATSNVKALQNRLAFVHVFSLVVSFPGPPQNTPPPSSPQVGGRPEQRNWLSTQ